jgi:hypothetical protein
VTSAGHLSLHPSQPEIIGCCCARIWPQRQHLDEDKRFKSTELIDASATAMLDEVQGWTESLAVLRSK